MSYSQFIHGKIVGERNYKLVAMTADLVGREDELEAIAQKYRFWGQQPPGPNPIAVGVFRYGQGLLVGQAMAATLSSGQPALDVQGRPYSQHRYVFLPDDGLKGLAGRLWLLLNWIMEETRGIPTFAKPEPDLAPIPESHPNGGWYNPGEELEKLCRALQLRGQEDQPVLLATLAALINGKRVVFDAADTDDVFSEDLLEGTLLLLPAVCRAQVAVAAGALDEKVCVHANLMVKTNGSPSGPLGPDLIWAKRANNQFFGAVNGKTLHSDYTDLLKPILTQNDSLNLLLRILDGLDRLDGTAYKDPWQALHNGWLTTRLIPALPDPAERAKYWKSVLADLSPEGWRNILPAIIDETGLEIAWNQLQQVGKRQPAAYAPLIFQLWQNFSRAYIHYVLQEELPADLKLAEILLRHGLLTELGSEYQADLFKLSRTIVAARAAKNQKEAAELADTLLATGFFGSAAEQFAFKEAVLLGKPTQAALFAFFNTEMALLLPYLTPAELAETQTYSHFSRLDPDTAEMMAQLANKQARALDRLPDLAVQTGMNVRQRVAFYGASLTAWQPAYTTARLLLADLVTCWIAEYDPEQRPPLPDLLKPLAVWLKTQAPQEISRRLVESKGKLELGDWQMLAEELYDSLLGQVSFMDHATTGQPTTTMTRQWLLAVAKNSQARSNFEASYTWHNLQDEGPGWLAEAVAQLLGWQTVSLSAFLPVIERLQTALNLPQALIFKFLEALPRQGDEDMGMMLAAYLPGLRSDREASVETIPLWQVLATQAPKVAQVYKVLAEGEKNVAVDLFNQLKLNGALAEAPEYAPALAHWLYLCGKGSWISGRLLETIVDRWAAAPDSIDAALLTALLRPDLTTAYSVDDWLALAQICWLPDYQPLWPLRGQPPLNSRQSIQALNLAKERIKLYTRPEQVEKLLTAGRNWGFTSEALAEVAGNIPLSACNFSLLHPYLYVNGAVLNPNTHTAQNLIARVVHIKPEGEVEQAHLKTFLTNLVRQQLQRDDGLAFVANWYRAVNDKAFYEGAVSAATLQLAPAEFSLLVKRAHQLKEQKVNGLSQTLTAALDQYWTGERRKLEK